MSHPAAPKSFFTTFLVEPAHRLLKRRRDRQHLSELLNLSDALLRDIGLTRFDIREAMRTGELSSSQALSRIVAFNATAGVAKVGTSPSISETLLRAA